MKMRTKIISILLIILNVILIGTNVYAYVEQNIEVSDIQIYEKLEKDYEVGFRTYLTTIVTPDNATDKKVTWTSSNEDIALVYPSGLFVALNPGTVEITATSSNGMKSTRQVRIVEKGSTEQNTIVSDSNSAYNEQEDTKYVTNKQENQSSWLVALIVVVIVIVLSIVGYIVYSKYKKNK